MDNNHHNIPHGLSLPERMLIGKIRGAFSVLLGCWVFLLLFLLSSLFLLTSLFIVVFLHLNGVPRVGTCPISPYLQLLGVVVRTEKYGCVRHKALKAIKAAFP